MCCGARVGWEYVLTPIKSMASRYQRVFQLVLNLVAVLVRSCLCHFSTVDNAEAYSESLGLVSKVGHFRTVEMSPCAHQLRIICRKRFATASSVCRTSVTAARVYERISRMLYSG